MDGTQSPVDESEFQEPGEFKCEECPRSFALKSNLARHQVGNPDGFLYEPAHENLVLKTSASSQGQDEPAHMRRLIL